jgi:two-component system, chemotaxis family, CheB/CheR fusion protein
MAKKPKTPAGRAPRSAKAPTSAKPVIKFQGRGRRVGARTLTTRNRTSVHGTTIVGVGASAGGLEAFSQLLRSVPGDAGVAIVFVQHLAPQHDSALVPLLTGQTAMPVIQVTEGLRVLPNRVYVIPPNVQMKISGGELHLTPRPDDRSQYTPVDSFLTSLAEACQARAMAVVLSGTASDGALGIREIKAAGGITFAQSPESAKYDGMPRAAIATGMVDLVLAPSAIGAKLAQLSNQAYNQSNDRGDSALPDTQFQRVFELLRPVSGVDFRHYKLPTIKRRLFRRMALHGITDPEAYLRLLEGNPVEVRSLYQDLLIHVTRFFREPQSFSALAKYVFPTMMEGRAADLPLRIWVSGCATGEEAYSLAIALVEFLQKDHADTRIQIFATDVSETAIEFARAGVYPRTIDADVSSERLRRFFTKHDGGYRVSTMIRDLCVFARQDLTKDPPFSRLDLILCRNVLIYMDAVLQKKLLSIFHYALNSNGYLMLGHAETVGAQATLFSLVDKEHRIHRKKPAASGVSGMTFPIDHGLAGLPRKKSMADVGGAEKALQGEVSRIILDRYAPAGVVIDGDMQILQFRGQTGTFLEPAPGEASLNLLKMVREGLLYGLRTALHSARKSRTIVQKDGLQVRSGQGWKSVSIDVVPLTTAGRPHYLVLFEDRTRRTAVAAEAVSKAGKATKRRASKRADATQLELLQRELAASREYMQSIIQELEAANEELQSANEEILSSNEELQSTNEELDTAKEELQSTNEELNTVNEELHGRNDELSRVNSDLLNLVGSVQIAIVIVTSDLRIRRFTPMAEKVLNLIPTDLERAIGHINPNIDCPNLEQLITECIDTVSPVEREVQDRQGRWYSLRIRPYKNVDNKIDGAVIALFDIDAPKRSEESVRRALEFAESVLQLSEQPMAVLENDLKIRFANDSFLRAFGASVEDARGRSIVDVAKGFGSFGFLSALATTDGDGGVAEQSVRSDDGGSRRREMRLRARTVNSYDSSGRLLVLTIADAAAGRPLH